MSYNRADGGLIGGKRNEVRIFLAAEPPSTPSCNAWYEHDGFRWRRATLNGWWLLLSRTYVLPVRRVGGARTPPLPAAIQRQARRIFGPETVDASRSASALVAGSGGRAGDPPGRPSRVGVSGRRWRWYGSCRSSARTERRLAVRETRDRRAARARDATRLGLAAFCCGAGVLHFVAPAAFELIVPPYLPHARALVLVSGFFEVVGGVGLLAPHRGVRRAAGCGLAALLVAVFPANVHMAVSDLGLSGVVGNQWVLWLRLPFQPLLIWAVMWCVGPGRRGGVAAVGAWRGHP